MRVCYIAGSFPPDKDGVGDFAWHISQILPEFEFSKLLIILNPKVDKPEGYQIIQTNFNVNDLLPVRNKILKFKPDIVLIEYPCKGYGRNLMINILPTLLKISDQKITIALNIHEYSNYTWRGKIRVAMMCLMADKVMVTDKKNLILLSKIRNNVKAILPVPPQIPLIIKQNYDAQKPGLIFSYWGFVRPNKGLYLLIKAFKLYAMNNPLSELWLLTELGDSDYEKEIRNYLNDDFFSERVMITGYLENDKLSQSLSNSDVCLLPFTDGISDRRGTLKAALAMGIPVISTYASVANSPDGLVNKKNILLCNPKVQSIFEAMQCINKDSLRKRIGVNALSWSKHQNWLNIKEILRKVLINS